MSGKRLESQKIQEKQNCHLVFSIEQNYLSLVFFPTKEARPKKRVGLFQSRESINEQSEAFERHQQVKMKKQKRTSNSLLLPTTWMSLSLKRNVELPTNEERGSAILLPPSNVLQQFRLHLYVSVGEGTSSTTIKAYLLPIYCSSGTGVFFSMKKTSPFHWNVVLVFPLPPENHTGIR